MAVIDLLPWLAAVLIAPFVGSFLGVVAARWGDWRAIVWGRSACQACGHMLGARDLVPLLSWLIRRGRCRHCGAAIGWSAPAIELAALAVAVSAVAVPEGWLLWASLGLGWTLVLLAATDCARHELPDALTLPLIPAGLAVALAIDPALVFDHALGALFGFGLFAGLALAYRRLRRRDGLGLGDAKLLAAAGAWVGWAGLAGVILIAAGAGLVAALAMALAGHRLRASTALPFGPALALGLWMVWLHGPILFTGLW